MEKINEILQGTKDRLTFADRIELVNNAVETNLKQFAERLKSKDCSVPVHKGFILIEDHAIDETLKEFINGKQDNKKR